jgi:hypothetical protein
MLRAISNHSFPFGKLRTDETPTDPAGLPIPPQEWRAIISIRPNLLIEGPDEGAEKIIDAITTALSGPVREWDRPASDQDTGATLVVRRVDLLSAADHHRLLDAMNAEIATRRIRQVITTSTQPLFRLVESGQFPDNLYYRLNTIRLELTDVA